MRGSTRPARAMSMPYAFKKLVARECIECHSLSPHSRRERSVEATGTCCSALVALDFLGADSLPSGARKKAARVDAGNDEALEIDTVDCGRVISAW